MVMLMTLFTAILMLMLMVILLVIIMLIGKSKLFPLQARCGPEGG